MSQGLLLIIKTDLPVPDYQKWLECIANFDEFDGIPKVRTFVIIYHDGDVTSDLIAYFDNSRLSYTAALKMQGELI